MHTSSVCDFFNVNLGELYRKFVLVTPRISYERRWHVAYTYIADVGLVGLGLGLGLGMHIIVYNIGLGYYNIVER
jgi:hypothetical protein